MPFLTRIGAEAVLRMKQRVAAELETTFLTRYAGEVSIDDLLEPPRSPSQVARSGSGGKRLLRPHAADKD
ncbi:MAG: hypothetical protein KF720_03770 [Rubrivivax sp.]|nr:hypothetical protein [Rubrivivax sp.]